MISSSFKIYNVDANDAIEEIRKQAAENDNGNGVGGSEIVGPTGAASTVPGPTGAQGVMGPTGPAGGVGSASTLTGNTGSLLYTNGLTSDPQTLSQGPTGSMVLSRGLSALPVYGGGGYATIVKNTATSLMSGVQTPINNFSLVETTNNQFTIDLTAGSITVPPNGFYMYRIYFDYAANTVGSRSILSYLNGSLTTEMTYAANPTVYTRIQATDFARFTTTTTINIRALQDSGSTINLNGARLTVYGLNV